MISRRWVVMVSAVVLMLTTACSGIPTDGSVVDVTKVAAADPGEAVVPSAGQPPDEIVRGFLKASGRGSMDSAGLGPFAAARQFLTADAQRRWPAPAYQTVILSDYRVQWSSAKPSEATITGTTFGTLDPSAVFHEGGQQYKRSLRLTQAAGQWRITDPPPEVLIGKVDFTDTYQQSSVYFLDQATGTVVVPDPRYISVPVDKRPAKLIDLLLAGPGGVLARAVRSQLSGAKLRSNVIKDEKGLTTVDLTGVTFPNAASRRALAAQIVWTLSKDADDIAIQVGGKPLEKDQTDYTVSNFQSFNPDRTPGTGTVQSDPYYIDSGPGFNSGEVKSLLDGVPMWGPLGDGALTVVSAGMSAATGTVAAVTSVKDTTGSHSELVIGNPLEHQKMQLALRAATLTQPSFSRAGDEVWVVQNGAVKPEIYQISAAAAAELSSRAKIGSAALSGKGPVTALKVSPDGVRVAIVAGQKLYLGSVSTAVQSAEVAQIGTDKAAATITNLTQLGTTLTDVSAVVFNTSTELLVAAKNNVGNFRTISRLAIDGSYVRPVSDNGITSDVDALAVSNSGPPTLYATFNSRVYRLSDNFDGPWVAPAITGPTGLLYGSNPFFPE